VRCVEKGIRGTFFVNFFFFIDFLLRINYSFSKMLNNDLHPPHTLSPHVCGAAGRRFFRPQRTFGRMGRGTWIRYHLSSSRVGGSMVEELLEAVKGCLFCGNRFVSIL
jgi:hypothetical protein